MTSSNRIAIIAAAVILGCLPVVWGGQRRGGAVEEESPLSDMNVEELRNYQKYFYPLGMRDPLTMRRPTSAELNIALPGEIQSITKEEQMELLTAAAEAVARNLQNQRYTEALDRCKDILYMVDNEWAALRDTDMIRLVDEIRSYNRMAATLKRNQEVKGEFLALHLKVDGVIWSPTDAKAVVNGRTYAAGEIMTDERRQGDLRIEMIEEKGVIFQFQGIRFHLPVNVYAQPNYSDDI